MTIFMVGSLRNLGHFVYDYRLNEIQQLLLTLSIDPVNDE